MSQGNRILVVDDVPQNVRLLEDILTAKGYQVITATSGAEALATIGSSDPELVLLDVVMPGMSGFDVCREIRANPELGFLPVILVTALDSTEDRVKGIEVGADDFLTKPVDMHELLARVKSLLRIHELFETVQRQTAELKDWNCSLEEKVRHQVDELEKVGRLRRFLSPQVADLVVSSGNEQHLQGHRQQIATLFCDLRGFTRFSEQAEPEEAMNVLQQYHEMMGRLIFQWGGTIEHRAGDGIMVIFNDPIPCDDPAATAITLAVKMREAMQAQISDWRRLGYQLGFGVGVTVGYATLGLVGYEGRFDYTANGSSVNLAARLSDEAEDGQILVPEKVLAMTRVKLETEKLETRNLKGIATPITAYNVIGIETDPDSA